MTVKAHDKEVRNAVGGGWPFVTVMSLVISLFWFFYCLFNWTFTWWLPISMIVLTLVSNRYGHLLNEEEKRAQAKQDREVDR